MVRLPSIPLRELGAPALLVLPLIRGDEGSGRDSEPELAALGADDSGGPTKEMNIVQLLLVDDHAMMRKGLRSVLDAYPDIQVVGEARDGIEAVKLAGELRPLVVLMDINMPKMNGIEATEKIKQQYPETIIIGLSVNATVDKQEAMRRAGASRLLSKEVAVEQLYTVVQDAVTERDRGEIRPDSEEQWPR